MSDASKKKLREAQLGKKQSIETINKRVDKLRGRPLSLLHRQKISKSNIGKKNSSETKDKLRVIGLKRVLSDKTKSKISNTLRIKKINLGRKSSILTREKISKANKGKIAWNKGLTKATSEIVKKYSNNLKGKKKSLETIKKMRNAKIGKSISEATRDKHKQYSPTLNTRARISEFHTGRKRSLETRARISKEIQRRFREGVYAYKKNYPEKIIENILIKQGFKYQYQFPIGSHSADFIIFPNLIIECDGDFWHGTYNQFNKDTDIHPVLKKSIKEIQDKDKRITKIIENKGYVILRLEELFINKYPDMCEEIIIDTINRENIKVEFEKK